MNIWKIWQTANDGYDTFDSAVVAAETEECARAIHPRGHDGWNDLEYDHTWVPIDKVFVSLLGVAVEGTQAGVIVSSFNAG